MDWSMTKELSIPEGNVIRVESAGIVLWEKPQEGMTYTFTGQSELVEAATGWELYLLSDGTLTFTSLDGNVDVFLCGGGGSGAKNGTNYRGGGGGAGGYTTTQKDIQLSANTAYAIVVGDGGAEKTENGRGNDGEATTAFGYTANGGNGGRSGTGSSGDGGCGGSGGGAGGNSTTASSAATDGAINGADSLANGSFLGGVGQGTTTQAFAEICGKIYGSGGGGGSGYSSGSSPTYGKNGKGYFGAGDGDSGTGGSGSGIPNRGGGGGGGQSITGSTGGAGGSGIVIVRKHKAVADYVAIMPTDTNKFPAVLNGYGYEALHGDASGRSSSYVGSVYAKPWLSQPAKKLGHAFSEIGNWVGNFADYAYGDIAVGYSADSTTAGTQALNVWISPTLITAAEANALIEAANAHILYELFTPDPESIWYAVKRTSDNATGYLNPETGVFHQPKGGIPHA